MTTLLIVFVAALYVGLLFALAWWGDREAEREGSFWTRPPIPTIVFCLTLTIYNTSWSFFGSVGRAAKTGWDFLPIYIAPIFVLVACQPMLRRLIAQSKAQNATSIADFLAARYGKSQTLAAVVTLASLSAVLPYIALQLKAIATAFQVLAGGVSTVTGDVPVYRDTTLAVAVATTAFVVMFGVRHSYATGRHRGLMLAVAFEGVVKLVAFVLVACYLLFGVFDGPGALLERAARDIPEISTRLLIPDFTNAAWYSNTLIALFAFLCLPHLFHVMVVENDRVRDLRVARVFFPAYLAVFSIFMLPIAIAGILTFDSAAGGDDFMLTLPLAADAPVIALIAFIGGLSAATGMVIVASLSLSTMLCNDVIMPLILRTGALPSSAAEDDMSSILILVRRAAVVVIILLAYGMHRLVGGAYPLTEIGLVSFVAVAQFGPALIAALYWPGAGRNGALAGMTAGIVIWAVLLLLPMQQAGFGTTAGINLGLDPISFATLVSLGCNVAIFVGLSLFERRFGGDRATVGQTLSDAVVSIADLRTLAIRFVGMDAGKHAFDAYLSNPGTGHRSLDSPSDTEAAHFTETLLAGAIGAASARVVMTATLKTRELSNTDARRALDQASEALRQNYALLQGTLEGVSQGICAFDADMRILAWNDRFRRLLDLPHGFVRVGLPLSELVSFNRARQEYDPRVLPALPSNRDLSTQTWPYTYERERPDGTMLEITFDRMPDGGFVSTYTDVSERHRAAEALRRAKATLEERVTERTHALEQAKVEAEDANIGKTRFIAAASHDLLQPLNAARLFVTALEDSLAAGPAGPRERRMARDAGAALRSTEVLIETLLEISSLDSAAVKPHPHAFRVADLLQPLATEFTAIARQGGLELKLVPSSLAVHSDPVLLRRILQNLLSNAVRHTRSGRILLGCRAHGDSVRIEVWDTGPGIDPREQQAIFQEFYRIRSDNGATEGMGLGLAIVTRIAALLGHQIGVVSRPGHGSCFHVTLPRAQLLDAPLADVLADERIDANDRALRLLCVDNDRSILAGLEAMLETWGHSVDSWDGRSAVPPRRPDAVLMDYHLDDGANGIERIQTLRDHWGDCVPALLLTADRSKNVRDTAAKAGIPLLQKPLRPAALRRFLGNVSRDPGHR